MGENMIGPGTNGHTNGIHSELGNVRVVSVSGEKAVIAIRKPFRLGIDFDNTLTTGGYPIPKGIQPGAREILT